MTDRQIEIYQGPDGESEIEVRLEAETVWLTQRQMGELFGKDVRTINEHVRNVFENKELDRNSTIRKFRIVRQEGSRQVRREVEHYNLDMAISVGYRVNSKEGTQFRVWATQRLREHLVQGYTLNRARFERNAEELEQALELVRKAAHLLYFVVKNHPFADGNKRSGAFLFVDFLHRNGRLFTAQGQPIINDTGLAALTLLVAESDPKQKDTLIRLIMNMLSNTSSSKSEVT